MYKVPYKKTSLFSNIVEDYIEDKVPKDFYNRLPCVENFNEQIKEKSKQIINRDLLADILISQNKGIDLTEKSENNILSLRNKKTFTITTGHQLCLFGGPLYFIYKIISAINLADKFKDKFPNNNFVPVFWMASEDHDFEEVNHINLFGKKYEWETNQKGMVGVFNTLSVNNVCNEIKLSLGNSKNAEEILKLFKKCYSNNTLSEATRALVNELFGEYGIVILDAYDNQLKELLVPVIKKDILEKRFYELISSTSNSLSKTYKIQASVRKINFFKLSNQKRDRILQESS